MRLKEQWGILLLLLALAAPLAAQGPNPRPRRGFEALRNPRFVPAAKADFLRDDDRILGIAEGHVAKAYSVAVVGWHHIIEDQLGDLPILPTW